jgi:uncharacterized protein HemX
LETALAASTTKITTLETAQAAEQTKVTSLQTALADLTARFDKINSACLDDGARRLASAPCGAISKVQTTKDEKTDPVWIVVVVLLVVIGLSCGAGVYMFAKSKQAKKKKKKNPAENLYELKNFTQKRLAVAIFETDGAMNSANPLADVGVGNA